MRSPLKGETEKPQLLYEYLSNMARTIRDLQAQLEALSVPKDELTLDEIQKALEFGGTHELSLEGLTGQATTAQAPKVFAYTSLPDANDYEIGTLAVLDGAPDVLYYVSEGPPKAWVAL